MAIVSERRIEKTFAAIEAAANAGERCPQNKPFGPLDSSALTELYRRGAVMAAIYAGNFRRIKILTGPHRGLHTAGPPRSDMRPWKIVGGPSAQPRSGTG